MFPLHGSPWLFWIVVALRGGAGRRKNEGRPKAPLEVGASPRRGRAGHLRAEEEDQAVSVRTLRRLVAAYEAAGIVFTQNADGSGVRIRRRP